MNDNLKEWKLVQGALGLVAASALGFYVLSGNFQAREWFPFLPPSPPPNTLLYHADAMRRTFQAKRFSSRSGSTAAGFTPTPMTKAVGVPIALPPGSRP